LKFFLKRREKENFRIDSRSFLSLFGSWSFLSLFGLVPKHIK
jgi:hypothetical protein